MQTSVLAAYQAGITDNLPGSDDKLLVICEIDITFFELASAYLGAT